MPEDKTALSPRRGKASSRSERLAAALRANLRRRKAQARGRADESKPPQETGEPAGEEPEANRDG